MCGRYTLMTEEDAHELYAIVQEVQMRYPDTPIKTGEIYPTNLAPILRRVGDKIQADAAVWGFPHFRRKGVIINARSETAADKPTFARSLAERRCVVPASGFFEWDKSKQKILFRRSSPILYMAGLYAMYEGSGRYVILTTAANASVADVHDRMPLVLDRDQITPWLTDTPFAHAILQKTPPLLQRQTA